MDTHVHHVSLTIDAAGTQVPAIVYREPEAGYSFPKGYIHYLTESGVISPANDEGVIPYRERTQGPDEDLGLTWQFPK